MPMTKDEKAAEIQAMSAKFKDAEILIMTVNKGLDAKATNDLRVATRAAGVDYRVAKNSLAKIALKGTQFEEMADKAKGPVAYSTGKDGVATAKALAKFAAANDKLVIVGGYFEGKYMDAKAVDAFSKLPTLDEIRSKLVGLLQAPASQLVGVTKAYGEKENA